MTQGTLERKYDWNLIDNWKRVNQKREEIGVYKEVGTLNWITTLHKKLYMKYYHTIHRKQQNGINEEWNKQIKDENTTEVRKKK